jgi:hypothetical protein
MKKSMFQSVWVPLTIACGVLLAIAGCEGSGSGAGPTSSTDGQLPVQVNVNSGVFGGYAFTVNGGYAGTCAAQTPGTSTWSVKVANTGVVSNVTNLSLTQADVTSGTCTPTVMNIAVTTPNVTYAPPSPFNLASTLATDAGVFTTTTTLPPFPQIVFNGTFGNTGSPTAVVLTLNMYLALTASSLDSITSGSYSVTPNNAGDVPAPSFTNSQVSNSTLTASGGLFTAVAGGYKFSDTGAGATSVIVYGPTDASSANTNYANTPVYALCNAPASTSYTTVDSWYTDFTGSNTGGGVNGNLTINNMPASGFGNAWNLAYNAAGTVGSVIYQYGLGYTVGNLSPADNITAVVFHYNNGDGIDTFQVYCLTVSL